MKKRTDDSLHFHVRLSPHEVAAVVAALILVAVIGAVTIMSDLLTPAVFGLYSQLIGAILLGFGLAKTNDELLRLANHYENLHKQELITKLSRDRFFVVLGVFLMALGLLAQIISLQFFA